MARIDAFFKLMAEQKASDLHLSTNNPPMLRINGDLVRVDYPALKDEELKTMVYEIAPEAKIKHFEETLDVDFGYEVPDVARYRANFFQQKRSEEHTSELQSLAYLVCRLLLEKKNKP